MKIIHTADLHLGSKLTTNLKGDKAKIRKSEILYNFSLLLEKAKELGAEIVIIAGDLFDTGKITKQVKDEVLSALEKHNDVKVIYVVGNHENTAFVDMLESVPENLICISSSEWQSVRFGDVNIVGANLNSANNKILYKTLNLSADDKNIVVLHGETAKHKSSEPSMKINIPELADKNIDYLSLGHYHSYTVDKIDNRGIYVYSGCLEGRGFDELGEKGFVLIDTDDIKNPKFIPFSKRELHEIVVDITGLDSWQDVRAKINEEVEHINSKNLIKVVISGKYDYNSDLYIFTDSIETQLNSKFWFAKVYDETQVEYNEEDLENGIGLRAEFLKRVNADESLSEHDKSEILQIGIKALKGEDL